MDVVGGQVGQRAAAPVGVWFTRIALAWPGASMGWQRACMEVFSSALMTYSSAPIGSPSQLRA
ncbi:hypothetical protein ACWD7C_25010 [Streptomyces sp. NPDC005134]|uniref:hypothetical protein n=1 Tax=unclassified Streptomyces TaxID=2593676 RepID=UPI0033A8EB22